MKGKAKPIPEGHHTVTPYLIVKSAAQAIEFYKKAFHASEIMRFEHEGKIGHAEVQIGDSRVMLADENPEMGIRSPESWGGAGVGIMLYVEDVDRVFADALRAGAKQDRPVEDRFYGDRSGALTDPFGHAWWIATHKEDVSMEELRARAAAQPVSS